MSTDDSPTTWTVAWTGEARRSLRRVPPRIIPAVFSFVQERLAVAPLRVTHSLRAPLDRQRSANVGSYRILVEIDQATKTVYIVKVAYHADVYRPS